MIFRSVLKMPKFSAINDQVTKTSKVNNKKVSENSAIYHNVRATLSD